MSLLVNAPELVRCAAELKKAVNQYEDAVAEAKRAGDQLASEWKGAACDEFVNEQEKAYEWHLGIIQIAAALISEVDGAVREYLAVETRVKQNIG